MNFLKLIVIFFTIFFGFFINISNANSIAVEDIFSDISADYKYKKELQTLYDKGMIKPDSNGKFNPKALLNRDEFVGILMESTCSKCIKPNTSIDLINTYKDSSTFFDIKEDNKYFYCIAEANEKSFVSGYHEGTQCSDQTQKDNEKPFCAQNTIILEEAIAIILRASGILSSQEANIERQKILSGEITESISDDVSPKNIDGSVYSFYPDLKKALEYEIVDVDSNGNIETYTLIELDGDNKIRPKKTINKEEFLRIAYITLKASSCEEKIDNNLALKMRILEKSCDENKSNCNISDLKDIENTYDFTPEVYTTCEQGISEPEGYIWRFFNENTNEEIKKYGKYIDNYKFLSNGTWKIFLRVIDKCSNTGEVYNIINVNNDSNYGLNVSIIANPIYGEGALKVNYEGIVSGGEGPFNYSWDFGDSNKGFQKNPENIFIEKGVYNTILVVTDKNGKKADASVLIQVIGIDKQKDSDNDGILDIDDLCPLIKGDIKNNGCPILEKTCNNDNNCNEGSYCDKKTNVCLPKILDDNICEYNSGDIIFGNLVCNSCPCSNRLDFSSNLRKCDIIFPAITSPDSKEIFNKGNFFQIKQ